MKNKLLTHGNSKMGSQVACFSLPPIVTCTPSSWCLTGYNGKPRCYALRGRYRWKSIQKSLDIRLKASKRIDFIQTIIKEILKSQPQYVRIHVTGDFYSAEYVHKWIEIAKACPNTLFRSTTRRIDLIEHIYKLDALLNVSIRESIDSSQPKPKSKLRLAATGVKVSKSRKQIQCAANCMLCNYRCWHERDKDEVFSEF